METSFFHPNTVHHKLYGALPKQERQPVPLRVCAAGVRAEIELEMGDKLSRISGTGEEFALARYCSDLPGHEGSLVIMDGGAGDGILLVDHLLSKDCCARRVLACIGETFSQLTLSILRLQDEGIAHCAIVPGKSLIYHPARNNIRLGSFSCALPIFALAPKTRPKYYPEFDPDALHRPPELHLLTLIVHSPGVRVTQEQVNRVREIIGTEEAPEFLQKLVDVEVSSAVVTLESTWRSWDGYGLSATYSKLIHMMTEGTDISMNPWLCGILSVLENGYAADPSVRPGVMQLRRLFEQALYTNGDVESCQRGVDAIARTKPI